MIAEMIQDMQEAGLMRPYTSRPGKDCKQVFIRIPGQYVSQPIYFTQDSEIDLRRITAIEFPTADELSHIEPPDGVVIENLTAAQLANFTFTLAIKNKDIFSLPLSVMTRANTSGKFTFVDSLPGNHIIGDSYLTQMVSENLEGRWITAYFYLS